VEHAGETISKERLIAHAWPDTVVDDGALRVHVAALRKALGDGRAGRRYVANNPGVFLFHCHIEWHVEMGLTATIIEAPEMLRNIAIPQDHIRACKALDIATKGNAGGNVTDPLDTSNYNTSPSPTYIGATYVPPSSSCPAKRRKRSARKAKALRI